MSNESITITQSINSVTVAAVGSVGLNAGGLIQGNLEVDGNVIIDGLLTVGADTDGKDVRFWGETASKYTLWDASQDKLIITGDLQVDGTTTTINSTVVTIEDPVFTLGGEDPPVTSDSKDRGIEFHYYDTDASAGKKGFFGWGNSDNAIKFLLNCADPSGSEIFTGDLADLQTGGIDLNGNAVFSEGGSGNEITIGYNTSPPMGDAGSGLWHIGGGSMWLKRYGSLHLGYQKTEFTINDLGVAIGTDSPSAGSKFEVVGGVSDTYAKLGPYWDFTGDRMSSSGALKINAASGEDLHLQENGTDRLVVRRTTGYVGIGTSIPSTLLHLKDDGGNTGATIEDSHATEGYSYLSFKGRKGTHTKDYILGYDHPSDTFAIVQGSGVAGTKGLHIDGSGNVGIGTASPNSTMTVKATGGAPSLTAADGGLLNLTSGTSTQLQFGAYPSGDYGAWIQQKDAAADGYTYPLSLNPLGGNVGIGTTSPSAQMQLFRAATSTLAISHTNTAEGSKLRLTEGEATYQGGYFHYDGSANTLHIGVHNANSELIADDKVALSVPRSTAIVEMDRGTSDIPFIDYKATADADTTSAISTLTTSGATTHHIQVDINGTKAWVAVSTNNPS